jgi:predicted enzyme related to lactoylglutathione lyase
MSARLSVYVYTAAPDRLREFYQAGLGVAPAAQHGNWLPFELGGGTFALHGATAGGEHDPRDLHLSFVVDDIEAAVARFRSAGARVLRDVADEAFGKRAHLEDPDGRTFELIEPDRP